ncbi:hypothetical protein QML01_28375, partial [Klebsiella pneumoniae]
GTTVVANTGNREKSSRPWSVIRLHAQWKCIRGLHGQIDLGTCVAFASLLSMQAGSTRVPENAVQQVLAGKGCKVTSLLKPVVWTMRTNI